MHELRDGTQVRDVRLDRLRQFDPRSRAYNVAEVLPDAPLRTRTWQLDERLDQSREGACVGFGVTHRLLAAPLRFEREPLKHEPGATRFARESIYFEAQKIDPWPGGAYPGASPRYEGTSVLAGIKVAQRLGFIGVYRWAFNVADVLLALATEGPVIVGTDWLDSMFEPRPSGLLDISGSAAGGQCYTLRGLTLKPRLKGESNIGPVVRVTNSWGRDWGVNGEAYLRVGDLEQLLAAQGEAVIPTEQRPPLPARERTKSEPRPEVERSGWWDSWVRSLPYKRRRRRL